MRLFFAIPLPERLQDELARFQTRTRLCEGKVSWVSPGGLHLTLAFLGEQDGSRVPVLFEVALRAASRHPVFPLKTSHLGGFPKDRSARVLWLGLDEQPGLSLLAEDLRKGLRETGISIDEKPFNAHLTLARCKAPQNVAQFGEPPAPMAFEARGLVLFQSVQTPSGSRYLALGTAPLRVGV